jgi:hypothetical protein
VHAEPGNIIATTFMPIVAPTLARFSPAFRRTLPQLTEAELGWCLHFMIGAIGHTLTGSQTLAVLTKDDSTLDSWPEMLDRLVVFCAAGFRAAARPKCGQGGD